MNAVPRYDVEALKRARPIAELLAVYGVELRPGGRALIGRCLFHPDGGRPNLYVYPASNSWYCYRCGLGGDAIAFVQRHDRVGFVEACERLAGSRDTIRAGTRAAPPACRPTPPRRDRLTLAEQAVMNMAAAHYRRCLWRTPRVLAYLRRARGLPDAVIRDRGLGYSDGHSLEVLLGQGPPRAVALRLGLLREPRPGLLEHPREFLAGRVSVPELRGGNCIWFIGRAAGDQPHRSRYLALPGERPVLGLEQVVGEPEVFLCEGPFDWLTALAWGLPACSACGTALPAGRLGFLARADRVFGVLDPDPAGQAGAARFGARLGSRWCPVRLPPGRDLNDLGRDPDGRAVFERALTEARGLQPSISVTQEYAHAD